MLILRLFLGFDTFSEVFILRFRSRIIFDSHEDWPMLEKVQNWFVGKYYERKQKKLIGNVDALLTVSDELAVRLEGGTVLYNSELLKTVEKPVLHDRFGLNGIVAGYIGALRKPILEEILEAASKVNALSILIVGGPPKGQAGYTNMIEELEELMPGATLVTCSGFGDAIIDCM